MDSQTSDGEDRVVSIAIQGTAFTCRLIRKSLHEVDAGGGDYCVSEWPNGTVIYQICVSRTSSSTGERVTNSYGLQWLGSVLLDTVIKRKGSDESVSQCVQYLQEDMTQFERGVVIRTSTKDNFKEIEGDIQCLLIQKEAGCFGRCYRKYVQNTTAMTWCLVSMAGNIWKTVEEGVVQTTSPMTYHPAFIRPTESTLFFSFTDAVAILEQVNSPECSRLLEIIRTRTEKARSGHAITANSRNSPFIAVEGFDGSGKTTLCRSLAETLGASVVQSPLADMQTLHSYFYVQSDLVRRAYYSISNYILADKVREGLEQGPVLTDRFWHSTAAYAMAKEVRDWGPLALPPQGNRAFSWPTDLLKPDIVLYLHVTENVRNARMTHREGENLTQDEALLKRNRLYRKAIDQAHRRMGCPHVTPIDSSGSPEEVLAAALKAIRKGQS